MVNVLLILLYINYTIYMAYFNYHAKAKNKIKNGELKNYEIVDRHNAIAPALVLTFIDGTVMPIRQHKWEEYITYINQYSNLHN